MPAETVDVSILVISYNTRDLTLACLRSLYKQTQGIRTEVIVVDNASSDGSADTIAEQFPQAHLIRLDRNVGFAGGNNLAARHANGKWLLLLNPDTVVLDGAIQRLHAFARSHSEASIFGGRTLFADGSLNPWSCWRRPTLWSLICIGTGLTSLFPRSGLLAPESYGAWKRDTVREVDIVSGCFLLIQKRLWAELSGFDPAFFMYGEEVDLCLRAKRLGHRCLICPEAQIIHYGGASEQVRADQMVRLFTAKAKLFARHWSPQLVRFGVFALDLWAFSRMMAFRVLGQLGPKWGESYASWRSIWQRRMEWRQSGGLERA